MFDVKKVQATVYRKGKHQVIFLIEPDTAGKVRVWISNGKTARMNLETWKQAIAHERRLIKAGWSAKWNWRPK